MDKNISKIKYLSVADSKIYKVTDIDFRNLTIEATETDLSIEDVQKRNYGIFLSLRILGLR